MKCSNINLISKCYFILAMLMVVFQLWALEDGSRSSVGRSRSLGQLGSMKVKCKALLSIIEVILILSLSEMLVMELLFTILECKCWSLTGSTAYRFQRRNQLSLIQILSNGELKMNEYEIYQILINILLKIVSILILIIILEFYLFL